MGITFDDGRRMHRGVLVAAQKVKNNFTKRLSYQRYKKMRSHLEELRGFFLENLGALENMIDAGMEEERDRQRKNDKN